MKIQESVRRPYTVTPDTPSTEAQNWRTNVGSSVSKAKARAAIVGVVTEGSPSGT